MFTDKVYKIAKNTESFIDCKNDIFTWGVDVNNTDLPIEIASKINDGIKRLGAPWQTLIPYYDKSFFVFNDVSVLTFLIFNCNLTIDELNKINEYYKFYEISAECITSGISKIRGTIFLDEITNIKEITPIELYKEFTPIFEDIAYSGDVKLCKERYYNKFKFKINF